MPSILYELVHNQSFPSVPEILQRFFCVYVRVCVCVCVCVCKEQPKSLNHPSGSPPRSSSGAQRVQVIQSTPGVEGISHANGSQVQDRINYL